MSVLIKGMEMPTSCDVCRFAIDGFCYASGKVNVSAVEERQVTNYCPLVPIPKHGRLIDADALEEWLFDDNPNPMKAPFRLCTADRTDVKFLMKKAPTIIPAEEGE